MRIAKEKKLAEEAKLLEDIKNHYNEYVLVNKDVSLIEASAC